MLFEYFLDILILDLSKLKRTFVAQLRLIYG